MPQIESLTGLEILDSRGRPTVKAYCTLASGVTVAASVPSGASTGLAEALELRDGETRYGGLGCRKAAAFISGRINRGLRNRTFERQQQLDDALIALDGTENKSELGANAMLAVSLAFARAAALERNQHLYDYFGAMLTVPSNDSELLSAMPDPQHHVPKEAESSHLPRLTVNLFSGGKHAGGQIAIQDVLIVPTSSESIDTSLATIYAVYQSAAKLTQDKYGSRALTADEGGLAPPFPDVETMLTDALLSIEQAGYRPGEDVALAVDVASSHFYEDGFYHLGEAYLGSREMIDQIDRWVRAYPIVSVEDGLAEDDWTHWPELCKKIGARALVLGDDLLCTNPQRIQRALDEVAANALLLKVNQIGTLSEAAHALQLAREAGWRVTVSARSGETEDDWLADLAVGWQGDQIKVGSITQSERLAKYNRLLEIEAHTEMSVNPWPR